MRQIIYDRVASIADNTKNYILTKDLLREGMNMPFETRRHYFADSSFENNIITVKTTYGSYHMYDLERSVCDCIRFREEVQPLIYEKIILNHKKMQEEAMVKRMLAYAKAMKFEKKMREDI